MKFTRRLESPVEDGVLGHFVFLATWLYNPSLETNGVKTNSCRVRMHISGSPDPHMNCSGHSYFQCRHHRLLNFSSTKYLLLGIPSRVGRKTKAEDSAKTPRHIITTTSQIFIQSPRQSTPSLGPPLPMLDISRIDHASEYFHVL